VAPKPLDLARFETRIRVRNTTPEDFEAIIALQEKCFPGMRPWSKEQLAGHVAAFRQGQFVVEVDGQVIGSSASLVVDTDEYGDVHTFNDITGRGTLSTHDDEGSDLYGIEVMVDPDYRNMKIGERLYEARKQLVMDRNLRRIVVAGRIPFLSNHPDMSPKAYVAAVARNELHDPVLDFQLSNGFVPKRILPGYLPTDKPSLGHAVLMEWSNIDYQPTSRRRLRGADPVRICVIQYQMRKVSSFDDFARQTEYFVDVAAGYGSDFAVFPELLTTQLLSAIGERDPGKAMRMLSHFTTEYIEHFADLALRYNTNILAGTHVMEEDGRLYNVAFLFRRDGTIARQKKLHITPNERRWWGISPGDRQHVFDTDAGKVAIVICYDVEFPETARIAVDAGARVLFVPYCTEDRQGHLRVRYCAQARAIENQVYVVTAGTVGNLPDTKNMDIQYAQSAIFTPSDFAFPRDGVAAEASPNVETVIVGDVDLETLRRSRRSGTVMQLHDRRHDLYEVLTKGNGLVMDDEEARTRVARAPHAAGRGAARPAGTPRA
jgi:predicted amidohydrolase/ribosomal protein S18 acetylase RimI-like enzyme